MHASGALLGAVALCFSKVIVAGPVFPKAVTASPLAPWVSVDASGTPVSTITPVLTTISGMPTTIGAVPDSITATTTKTSDSKPTETAPATGGGSYQVCSNLDQLYAPFCKPDNGSSVWVDNKYYVTWDPTYFTLRNATLLLIANYVNESEGGAVAFQSPPIGAQQGFYVWDIDESWMKGHKYNNVTLFMNPIAPTEGESHSLQGPTLQITTKPAEYYQQPHTKVPTGQSLYIALPTVFGFIVICVCGGFIINRKQRQIGLGNIMGRRKGYGVSKSRPQRMGLGKKGGTFALREQELTSGGQYRDRPDPAAEERRSAEGHARADSDALGSLAGTPTEERRGYFEGQMRPQQHDRV